MKKLGTIACAALASLCTANLSAAVESDIVGYTTITMEAGKWYQIGNPFINLADTDAETVAINDVFTVGFADGDELNILDLDNLQYNGYYWKSAAGGWCTKRGSSKVNTTIRVGQAVFINKAVAADVVLSGRVADAKATDFGTDNGNAWSQIVCVYPQDMKLNDMVWTGMQDGDEVNILDVNDTLYDGYYWKSAAGGWCTKRGSSKVDVLIPAGKAMFINKISAGKGSVKAH